jgi:hypothetical protein
MHGISARTRVAVVVATLALAGCGAPSAGSEIDDVQIGRPVDCSGEFTCDRFVSAGVRGYDQLHPKHAPIVEARLYEQARIVARTGGPILVVAIRLLDGSAHAIGVGHVGIEPDLHVFRRPDGPGFVPSASSEVGS